MPLGCKNRSGALEGCSGEGEEAGSGGVQRGLEERSTAFATLGEVRSRASQRRQVLDGKDDKVRAARAHLAQMEAELGAAADAYADTKAELKKAHAEYGCEGCE